MTQDRRIETMDNVADRMLASIPLSGGGTIDGLPA
jgi:hypothetical protein